MQVKSPFTLFILLSMLSLGGCSFIEDHAVNWKGNRDEDTKKDKDPPVDPTPNEALPSEVKFAKAIQEISLLKSEIQSDEWSLELTLKTQASNGTEELQTLKLISDSIPSSEEKSSQKKIIFQNSDESRIDLVTAEITCFDFNCANFAGVLKSNLESHEGSVDFSRKRYVPKNANLKMESTFAGLDPLNEIFRDILDPVSPTSTLDPRMRDKVKTHIDLLHIKKGKTFFELSRFLSDQEPFGYALGVSDVTNLSYGIRGSLGKNASLQLIRSAKSKTDKNKIIDPLSGNANFGITESSVIPQKTLLLITRDNIEGQFLIEIEI